MILLFEIVVLLQTKEREGGEVKGSIKRGQDREGGTDKTSYRVAFYNFMCNNYLFGYWAHNNWDKEREGEREREREGKRHISEK